MRLSDDDSTLNVVKLMEENWKLLGNATPQFCISVIGGAREFRLNFAAKEIICKVSLFSFEELNFKGFNKYSLWCQFLDYYRWYSGRCC